MKSIEICGGKFDVPDDIPEKVWHLCLDLSAERDFWREKYEKLQEIYYEQIQNTDYVMTDYLMYEPATINRVIKLIKGITAKNSIHGGLAEAIDILENNSGWASNIYRYKRGI